MTFAEAAKIAKEAEVKELWLTHYSPALVRPEDFEENAREIFPNSHVCRDGRTVTLLFENEE